MIPLDTIQAMFKRGALLDDGNGQYTIDFYIVKNEFPSCLETMVLQSLNDFEKQMYNEGYMAFIVLEDGRLQWKPTGKPLQ